MLPQRAVVDLFFQRAQMGQFVDQRFEAEVAGVAAYQDGPIAGVSASDWASRALSNRGRLPEAIRAGARTERVSMEAKCNASGTHIKKIEFASRGDARLGAAMLSHRTNGSPAPSAGLFHKFARSRPSPFPGI